MSRALAVVVVACLFVIGLMAVGAGVSDAENMPDGMNETASETYAFAFEEIGGAIVLILIVFSIVAAARWRS